jgi:hypothetical protein
MQPSSYTHLDIIQLLHDLFRQVHLDTPTQKQAAMPLLPHSLLLQLPGWFVESGVF